LLYQLHLHPSISTSYSLLNSALPLLHVSTIVIVVEVAIKGVLGDGMNVEELLVRITQDQIVAVIQLIDGAYDLR